MIYLRLFLMLLVVLGTITVGVADEDGICTQKKRNAACEKVGDEALTEEECLALKCCQFGDAWGPNGERCAAASVIPDDGEACCEEPSGDETCTIEKREAACEKVGDEALTKKECLALKCCQFDESFEVCAAANVIPDDGEACCEETSATPFTSAASAFFVICVSLIAIIL